THIIYVASPTAARSQNVIHEIEMARGEIKPVLAFWVRGEKWYDCVPFGWILAQRTDGRDAAYTAGLAKLLDTLAVTSAAPAAPSLSVPQQASSQVLSQSMWHKFEEVLAWPNFKPIGTIPGDMVEQDVLTYNTRREITVQNVGKSTAMKICAVLSVSVRYFPGTGNTRGDLPYKVAYLQGRASRDLAPGAICDIQLNPTSWTSMTFLRVTPQYTLYAAVEPRLGERRRHYRHSVRLTITCRNSLEERFATVFDFDVYRQKQSLDDRWNQIRSPLKVKEDLLELISNA
ncbi:MAG: hypothetical protein ACRDID_19240, partial [Ktedonobacterales bacterium]